MDQQIRQAPNYIRDLFSGHVEVSPPRAWRDAASRFVFDAIAWARKNGVHTRVLPTEVLPAANGANVLEGFLVRSDRSSTIGYFAFLATVAGLVARFAGQGLSSPAVAASGWWAWSVAAILGIVAVVVWRRDRVPLVAFIVADDATVKRLDVRRWLLRAGQPTTVVWLFARGGLSRAAIAFCEAKNVRCLVAHGHEFGSPIRPLPESGPDGLVTAA